MEKLDCFVDETEQDTKGKFFLVAIVLKERENLRSLEKQLMNIEIKSGKKRLKWRKTHYNNKKTYLLQITGIKALINSVFYSVSIKIQKNILRLFLFQLPRQYLPKSKITIR